MANNTTTSLSDTIKTMYEKRLLTRAIPRMVHNRWAKRATLSKYGTYEIRKIASLSAVSVALTEGTTPAENAGLSMSTVTITPAYYGAFLQYTDELDMENYDPIVSEMVGVLGEQAALSADTITRDVLIAGGTADYAGDATSRGTVDYPAMEIKYNDILKQVAALEDASVLPVDNEGFPVIIDPFTWASLMSDPDFVNLFVQDGDASALRTGYVGRLLRCKFYVTSNAKEWADEGVGSTTDVYGAIFIGQDSYAALGMAGMLPNDVDNQGDNGKPLTGQKIKPVEIIMKALGSAGAVDPLNQRGTVAWKMCLTPKVLDDTRIRILEHANVASDD